MNKGRFTPEALEGNNVQYNHFQVEAQWMKTWEREKTFSVDLDTAKRPFYNLMMFPYPSAEGLHVGNFYAFTGSDVHGRYKKMQGFDVLQPMWWDAFWIHSENYAKRIGSHPLVETPKNVTNFKRQFSQLGALTDWDNEVNTTSPDYYRWNQWLFLKLYENGLAYKKESSVNWCPECQTVISDEQVIDGKCERHGNTNVEKKQMEQWFLKITDFADELDSSLEDLNWSDKTKLAQKNWIGKKEWFTLNFTIDGRDEIIETFTTRIDTVYGITFIAVSCDSELADRLVPEDKKKTLEEMKRKKAFSHDTKKEWIFSGVQVIHPLTWEQIPVYIANYIDGNYGTGAVMWVPWHDQRDKEFSEIFGIKSLSVYLEENDDAWLVNSGKFNWLTKAQALEEISSVLEERKLGKKTKLYRLRDWCISRQRYWWTPIPMVNCKSCWIVPESITQLPVKLPEIGEYSLSNDGKSPLAGISSFIDTECPCCWGEAKRETDVMDNFFDSSWYFFRYLSAQNTQEAFNVDRANKWLPVDMYIWWNEHAVLHLMYTRFIMKALKRIGLVGFDEPFKKFFAHGLIIKDGSKMSKSKWNVINPDDYINRYWADALRAYLMFIWPLDSGGDFTDSGIVSMRKFLWRVYTFAATAKPIDEQTLSWARKMAVNDAISSFQHSMESYKYNVALSKIMTYLRHLQGLEDVTKTEIETLVKLLSIFCPYISEEIWVNIFHNDGSVHLSWWPKLFEDAEREKMTSQTLAVQVSWKMRWLIEVQAESTEEDALNIAKRDSTLAKYLDGKIIKKVVYVRWKILNIVLN